MSHVSYAYLRDGKVFRDEDAYEADDRLGTYDVIDDGERKYAETSPIGGKVYTSLWIWTEEDTEKGRDYGIVSLLTK